MEKGRIKESGTQLKAQPGCQTKDFKRAFIFRNRNALKYWQEEIHNLEKTKEGKGGDTLEKFGRSKKMVKFPQTLQLGGNSRI